jgi:hypothetical protein
MHIKRIDGADWQKLHASTVWLAAFCSLAMPPTMQPISLNSFLSFKTSAARVKVNHRYLHPCTLACQPTQCNITMR